MNRKILIVAAVTALAGSMTARAESVKYDFTGVGHVYTFTGTGHEFTDLATTFTGVVTFKVLTAGPSGPDSDTDGSTWARDRNGWVQSDFSIRWAGNRFNPGPVPEQYYSDFQTIVLNNDEGVVDRLHNREYYEGSSGDTSYTSYAELLRSTNDISWLSDLSFDVTAGLAPPGGADNEASNDIEFSHGAVTFNAAEARYDVTGFSGNIRLTSLNPRATIDIKPHRIDLARQHMIPVALLTTAAVDAAKVDPGTVLFGRTGTEASPIHWTLSDVDADGDVDLMLRFVTQAAGIKCGDKSASLSGRTFSNRKFSGSDTFVTGRCR